MRHYKNSIKSMARPVVLAFAAAAVGAWLVPVRKVAQKDAYSGPQRNKSLTANQQPRITRPLSQV
jgi:hypothetical protein